MRIVAFVLVVAGAAWSTQSALPQQEIENVAAFARLYGVVRYFYPSDAAAALDWNRFAVYGVGRVRSAADATVLESTLQELFTPLGPGVVVGTTLPPPPQISDMDATLVAWRYQGPGETGTTAGPYTAGRVNRAGPPNTNAFIAMLQSIPAAEHRGRAIRLSARARVPNLNAVGWAGLWLRVDRPNQQVGFFDNMQDRPIRSTEWREYVIEGRVADDATNLVMGPLSSGTVSADYDTFVLSVLADGQWVPIPIANGGFEEGTGAAASGWQRTGSSGSAAQAAVQTTDAADGQRYLRLTSSTGVPATAIKGAAAANAHVNVDLGSGLKARVRLSLNEMEAGASAPALDGLRKATASVADPAGRSDADVRLADVVVAWNVLRHFYPYWQEAKVDWDGKLRPQLALASAAQNRAGHRDALRLLVADARDGHGNILDATSGERRAFLPILLSVVDKRIVISASAVPADAPIGSIVDAISGRSSSELLEEGMRLSSGTVQWRQSRTMRDLVGCTSDSTVTIRLQVADGQPRNVALRCTASQLVAEPRPAAIAEAAPGIWYVDLTRATTAEVTPRLATLAAAAGIVFDLRGYPTDVGAFILRHLIDVAETDLWMHVPHITGPFGQVEDWMSVGWNLQPAAPRVAAHRVFLTDGRAISYAESVMGYVADRKLATIIGAPTAGTNGNVARASVPGGFTMTFTGMRVTRHDGRTPFHLAGITPDISVQPTLAGLRAGRDELLERALDLLRTP